MSRSPRPEKVRSAPGDDPAGAPLVDFRSVVRRLFWVAVAVAGLAVVGATIQGVVRGLTFAVLLQWGALAAVVFVMVGAAVLAVHAAGGARRARRRGERLRSDDVGLAPRGSARSLRAWRGAPPPPADPGGRDPRGADAPAADSGSADQPD